MILSYRLLANILACAKDSRTNWSLTTMRESIKRRNKMTAKKLAEQSRMYG